MHAAMLEQTEGYIALEKRAHAHFDRASKIAHSKVGRCCPPSTSRAHGKKGVAARAQKIFSVCPVLERPYVGLLLEAREHSGRLVEQPIVDAAESSLFHRGDEATPLCRLEREQ